MIQILPAKNGSPALLYGKTWLHSRYNPEAEAEKYVNSLGIAEGITHFILIECALGYVIPVLRAKFPGSVIFSLHCGDDFSGLQSPHKADFEIGPESPQALTGLLEREIPENASIKIIEWRPSLAVYQKQYIALLEAAADFLKLHTMSKTTAAYFEKRWQKNVMHNAARFNRVVKSNVRPHLPVVVAAAGPGLERSLPEIKKKQEYVYIVAVSSSLSALYEHGIRPDMIVATDGGFWALPHLYELARYGAEGYPLIAAALNARLPSFLYDAPVLFISDDSDFQNTRLSARRLPFMVLPQRGTVSATALDLAFSLTLGPVYIAGLDLCDKDVVSHARPHAFEPFFRARSNRFAPYYHHLYVRSRLNAESGTQDVYIAWFKNNLSQYAERLIALGGNNPLFAVPHTEIIAIAGGYGKKGVPAFETASGGYAFGDGGVAGHSPQRG
jgi:hypothetical protein